MEISEDKLRRLEKPKEKIGELLVRFTDLQKDQLEEALQIQEVTGMLLGEILLQKDYIKPQDITKVICYQLEIPYLDEINVDEIDPDLTQEIPINYAKQKEVLPILQTDEAIK